MAFTPRLNRQEEMVTPKEREALNKKKNDYIADINDRLNKMPDSGMKDDLIKKRDHCISKFPVFPADLSVWIVAYYEDWLREFNRAEGEGG